MIKPDKSFQSTLPFFFFFYCAFGDIYPFSLFSRWLLVMLSHAWQGFAWHALCIYFSVYGVSACVDSVCILCVCLSYGAVFTLLHVVYRQHPNLSSHCTVSSTPSTPQGYRYCCDLSALHVWFVPDVIIWSALCILVFSGLVSWLLLCKATSSRFSDPQNI